MNDFDIDKLMSDSLVSGSVSDAFRERVLSESMGALVRSRRLQKQLRVTGMILMVVMIAVGAFVGGEFWGRRQGITEGIIVLTTSEDEQRTSVPRELVAWLDTGRFFDSLDLQERAVQAYKKASKFVDNGTQEPH